MVDTSIDIRTYVCTHTQQLLGGTPKDPLLPLPKPPSSSLLLTQIAVQLPDRSSPRTLYKADTHSCHPSPPLRPTLSLLIVMTHKLCVHLIWLTSPHWEVGPLGARGSVCPVLLSAPMLGTRLHIVGA